MRARNLKPTFFKNDILGTMPMAARLLFEGLWCMGDREGRLEDRPLRIKAEILPYDDVDVDDLLNQLEARAFILRYGGGIDRYIQVINFGKHQNPHYKEVPSEIPAPDGWEDSGYVVGGLPESVRQEVLKRDGYRCLECGATEDLSIDHRIPRSKGGTHDLDNLRTLCRRCNSAKNNRLASADVDPTSAQHRVNVGSTSVNESTTSPADSLVLIPDSLVLIPEETTERASAPPPPKSNGPSLVALEIAETLKQAPWVGDELEVVATKIDESAVKTTAWFNLARDGPLLALSFVNCKAYAKKPPTMWYSAWLNWLKKERDDAGKPTGGTGPRPISRRGNPDPASQIGRDPSDPGDEYVSGGFQRPGRGLAADQPLGGARPAAHRGDSRTAAGRT